MDPSDLRAELAERLANSTPLDAETFNAACFILTRTLEQIEFSVPDAAPLAGQVIAYRAEVTGNGNAGILFNPNYSPAPPAARLVN